MAKGPLVTSAAPVFEVSGITKRFPGVLVNDNVCLGLRKGHLLGILGKNGVGTSTLMNMICGLYKPVKNIKAMGQPLGDLSTLED